MPQKITSANEITTKRRTSVLAIVATKGNGVHQQKEQARLEMTTGTCRIKERPQR